MQNVSASGHKRQKRQNADRAGQHFEGFGALPHSWLAPLPILVVG